MNPDLRKQEELPMPTSESYTKATFYMYGHLEQDFRRGEHFIYHEMLKFFGILKEDDPIEKIFTNQTIIKVKENVNEDTIQEYSLEKEE